MTLARGRGLAQLHTRLTPDRTPPPYLAALEGLGFTVRDGRMEFKTPIADLPGEEGTPLTWASHDVMGREAAGALFERAGSGPDWEESDVGVDLIDSYLTRDGMYVEADCAQVGSSDGTPVAFIIAQVELTSGWSTITFMGLVPEYRGRGLGTGP